MFGIFIHYSIRPIYDVSMNLFCWPPSVDIFNILPGFLWQPLLTQSCYPPAPNQLYFKTVWKFTQNSYRETRYRPTLNQVLTFCGLDTSRYQTHSFRIEDTSWAGAQGFSDSQIMPFRRWKPDVFMKYIITPSLPSMDHLPPSQWTPYCHPLDSVFTCNLLQTCFSHYSLLNSVCYL